MRRPAFDDIGDIDVFTLKMDGVNDLGQQLPGPPNKRPSLNIFIVSWPLTDKHEGCPWISLSKNDIPAGLAELASTALSKFVANLF